MGSDEPQRQHLIGKEKYRAGGQPSSLKASIKPSLHGAGEGMGAKSITQPLLLPSVRFSTPLNSYITGRSACTERSAAKPTCSPALPSAPHFLFFFFSSCPDAAARPANVSSRKPRCISPPHSQSLRSPPSFTRANAPRHADALTARQVEGNRSAARMLLASESTARDKSQGIPVPAPGSAQRETHFHHRGGRTSAFPLLRRALVQTRAQTSGPCFGLGMGRVGFWQRCHPNFPRPSDLKAAVVSSEELAMGSTRAKRCS